MNWQPKDTSGSLNIKMPFYEYRDNHFKVTMVVRLSNPHNSPDSKVHWANMGPTWVLLAPDSPQVAPWILLSWRNPNDSLHTETVPSSSLVKKAEVNLFTTWYIFTWCCIQYNLDQHNTADLEHTKHGTRYLTLTSELRLSHDDAITMKHFLHYWPFVRGTTSHPWTPPPPPPPPPPPHYKREVMQSINICYSVIEAAAQIIELPLIWNGMRLMSHYCNYCEYFTENWLCCKKSLVGMANCCWFIIADITWAPTDINWHSYNFASA